MTYPQSVPDSLRSLLVDPNLIMFKLNECSVEKYHHDFTCSSFCTLFNPDSNSVFKPKPVYGVRLSPINISKWGGLNNSTSQINLSCIVNQILSFCTSEELPEAIINLLRTIDFTKYSLSHVIDDLPKKIQSYFYEWLTQNLIHLSCDRCIVDTSSNSSYISRWPAITFMVIPGNNHNGIFFTYDEKLDTFNENYKITIFEPLLAYLSCIFNKCTLSKESFPVFLATQKQNGIFLENHNHQMKYFNWKFQFKRNAFLVYEDINRKDEFYHCKKCKNSSLKTNEHYFSSLLEPFSSSH